MSYPNLTLVTEGTIAILTINHPPANALNQVTLTSLAQVLDDLEQNDQVSAIVITGEGRFFIAGADIKEFTELAEQSPQQVAERGQQLFLRMETFSKPIIAAINGACLGGGLELAMACHIRYVAKEAKLGLPELNLGLIPGYGGTQRLPRLIGRGKATQLILTSDMIDGEEAHAIGLAEAVYPVEQLLEESKKLAHKISEKGAISVKYALDAIHSGVELGLSAGTKREAELFGQVFTTEDMKEGVTAFLEKRKPQFSNR
ncbi:enoyl-CoA hydratase [Brevibacillus laterosporus]|uniref:enoyl-CoA hydratase n=1 Tax=Brevibacillus laterosporus TaxID=1465 RepID=UPI0018CCB94B|nr:enoyl-CoA hydratase [Brevibacillus laterosporus]MBG9773365.1 enoyl-CoA hydratase [Brevibacillus laterosporus]MBG9796328.1 enoyl-CoA hydratase [Brevibacillus laterosporus]MCR8937335.1 enoyl-CoA hydratase [Brevibacillus laterosporus]MCZ0839974.1 enoyl-CoA hydratase [Brevibacillus laterosporus]MCZ0843456.1 enoyl-CoA hydratase [Brevibacillus laterosporus]